MYFLPLQEKFLQAKYCCQHNFQHQQSLFPFLLDDYPKNNPAILELPFKLESECLASDYYTFNLRLNRKITKNKFENQQNLAKHINQNDFSSLIYLAETQIENKYKKARIEKTNQKRYERGT